MVMVGNVGFHRWATFGYFEFNLRVLGGLVTFCWGCEHVPSASTLANGVHDSTSTWWKAPLWALQNAYYFEALKQKNIYISRVFPASNDGNDSFPRDWSPLVFGSHRLAESALP